jgi:two-component system sensor histidine kinase PilS (NtrC family)
LYNLYRLVLAGILLLVGLTDALYNKSDSINRELYDNVMAFYTILVILQNIMGYAQWPHFSKQVFSYAITDILMLLAIIYATHSVDYGIGILLVLPIIIPNILQPSPFSMLLAALSVIGLMILELNFQTNGQADINELSHTGVLSLFIMVSSAIAANWASKTQETATLAKQRGEDLIQLSQLNQTVLNELQLGVIVLYGAEGITHLNKAAIDILGKPKKWYQQALETFSPELEQSYQDWRKNHQPRIMSYDVNHQNTTALRAQFIQIGSKTSQKTLIYLKDTYEEREQLQMMKLVSLGQLTASIAHEIRNPLSSISHAAQLLSESTTLNKTDERLAEIIHSNSYRTDAIIESILNVSRRKNPTRSTIVLKDWLQRFFDDFLEQSQLKANQLSLFIEPADLKVAFDPEQLHQIMWNLSRNAVKYAKEDTTKLSILIQVGIPDYTRNTVLNVIDNGAGISNEAQQRLFEPFYTTGTNGKGGTGLGLFVSRELSQANGATLEYVDLPSGGTCFRLSFSSH